ncbi:MAG: TM2 domain-containing protein [Oscillospiraceae bacterium]|nr:TM2 domain-containing protein [Oscillospiraceae bacterium]
MICPNCGREVNEGETCVCGAGETTPLNTPEQDTTNAGNDSQSEPTYTNSNPNTYYQSPQQPNPNYYNPNGGQQYYNPGMVYVQKARTDYPEGYKIKKKYVAVILAFTFGWLGIHNFYLGNKTKAIVQVLLGTVGAIFVGVGTLAAAIWAIVEGVLLLTESIDSDGEGFKIQTIDEAINAGKKNE